MPRHARRFLPAGLTLAFALSIASWQNWDDQLWNLYTQWRYSDQNAALHGHWQLNLQPQALPETGGELSGLTWSAHSNSLFAVRNRPAAILELDTDGKLLREIVVPELEDPEAIVWLEGNRFAIADERDQSLYGLTIPTDATTLDFNSVQRLSLAIELNGNKGFEGLAYDRQNQRLYVAKERSPQRLYMIEGYTGQASDQITIKRLDQWQGSNNLFMDDFSGLHFSEDTGHLLVLSDESALVAELSGSGELIAFLELDSGFSGLNKRVPQAEGITMDADNTLYLLSEPDLFYRFKQKG